LCTVPRSLSLRQLFEFSDLLVPLRPLYDTFFNDFQAYKGQIPTYGCILLNAQLDRMVLVCNWKVGWGGGGMHPRKPSIFLFGFGSFFSVAVLRHPAWGVRKGDLAHQLACQTITARGKQGSRLSRTPRAHLPI
jgi:hypothetical protein